MSKSGRVLVIGGTSFIARHLLPRLSAAGMAVSATCREHAPAIDGVQWVKSDLGGAAPESEWPGGCNAVIYLAQSRRWRQFPDGVDDVFNVNVRGVLRAAEHARRSGASRFVLASTGSIYGGRRDTAEAQPITIAAPRHFYVSAKLAAEMLLAPYANVMHVNILRLFVPYGLGQSEDMLMPQLVRKVRNGEAIQLDGADGLSASPVAAGDVATAITRVLDLQQSATLNVAGPEALTLKQIGDTIGRVVGRAPVFEHRDGTPHHLVGSTEALRGALGWSPQTRLEPGLREWLDA